MRAAVYVRVSTDAQRKDGLSFAEQEKRCLDYISAKGWESAGVFKDVMSGKRDDRPELQKLLDSLDGIDCIVVVRLDRLGRNTKHMLEVYEALEAIDVALVSISDDIDTTTPMGKAMRVIASALAQLESETTGERVKAVMKDRASKGLHHGRQPYGYGAGMVPVEPGASIVRRIFTETAEGNTQKSIQEKLNAENVPPPKGTAWLASSISRMLENIAYAAKVEVDGELRPGQWEAIIDDQLWASVQRVKQANKAAVGKGRGRLPAKHLFVKGHLRCGICDSAMSPRTGRRKAKDTYQCLKRKNDGANACTMGDVPRAAVDQAVFDFFADVGVDLDATRRVLLSSVTAKQAESRQLLKAAKAEAKDLTAQIDRVRNDYTAGKIDAAEWKELREVLVTKQRQAQDTETALSDQIAKGSVESEAISGAEDVALTRLAEVRAAVAGEIDSAEDVAAARAALKRMFDTFYIAPQPPEVAPALTEYDAKAAEVMAAQEAEFVGSDLDEITTKDGGWVIIPQPRLEVVEDLEVAYRPVLSTTLGANSSVSCLTE